jgi:hypothetical protein
MNTKVNWITTVTIHDQERRQLWEKVFPGARVPVKSILEVSVNVPERGEVGAYMLDLDALTLEQIEGVCMIISKRFKIPIEEVRGEINKGVPIVADGVSVSTSDQGIFFSMMGDDDYLDCFEDSW